MKLFHLADLHLGKSMYERDMISDQEHALAQVVERARQERPACVILAGDIFDRAVPPPEAVSLLGRFLAELKNADPGLVIAMIPGNHDSPARLAYLSGVLDQAGVYVRAEPVRCTEPVRVERDGERVRLWLVPFLSPGAFPVGDAESGTAAESHERPRSQAQLFASAMAGVGAALASERDTDGRLGLKRAADVLVCHAFASGGRSGDSERAFLGTAELVDLSLCKDFDYVALGHLHRPQAAGLNGRYPGSLLAYSFSDADSPRGFVMLGCSDGQCRSEQVQLKPLRRMSRLSGPFQGLLNDPAYAEYENDYIEAMLDDDERVLNPMEPLRRRFPYILSIGQAAIAARADAATRQPEAEEPGPVDIQDEYRDFYRSVRGEEPDEQDLSLFAELLNAARDKAREGRRP